MKNEITPPSTGAYAPDVRLSGGFSRRLLIAMSTICLLVTAACESGALAPDAEDLWPSDARLLLNSAELDLMPGDTFRLHTTVVSGTGTVLGRSGTGSSGARGMPRMVWKSSNTSIADVDANGLVEAVGEGDAVISVSSGSLTSFSRATVASGKGKGGGKPDSPALTEAARIVLSPEQLVISSIGGSVQLSAAVYDGGDEVIASPTITWASEDPEVASVDGSGKVVASLAGVALIVATAGTVADTATVEVRPAVSAVTVTPESKSLAIDETVTLVATGLDSNGNPVAGATFTWSSSNAGVASVTTMGVVKAIASGSATVTATVSGTTHKSSASITVAAAASSPAPSGNVINPGEDIQSRVNSSPTGTIFTLASGVHRMQRIVPKDGQQFIGEPGAVLAGAKLLTSFVREGSYWVASGQSAVGSPHGSCASDRPRCAHPEDLFIDDRPLEHVGALSQVAAGKWFFDYGAGKVYIGENPSSRKVELGATTAAFSGNASNVVIRGLTVEKYANRAQTGAIHGNGSRNWVVEDNVIRYNHGVGVRIGHGMRVRNNRVLSNGQLGIGGIGDNVLVEGNEIAYNNAAGFSWGWEGGGTKFVRTHDLVIRGNHAHHNLGPGLWTDIDNMRTTFEDNLVEDHPVMGIFHEISYDAIIRNNTVRRNGHQFQTSLWGSGILISNGGCAPNPPAGYQPRIADDGRPVCVEIYGNIVEDNADGIGARQTDRGTSGVYGPWVTRGVYVHDNRIKMRLQSSNSGLAGSATEDPVLYAYEGHNRFDRNTYDVDLTLKQTWFEWQGAANWTRWRGFSQDSGGKLN